MQIRLEAEIERLRTEITKIRDDMDDQRARFVLSVFLLSSLLDVVVSNLTFPRPSRFPFPPTESKAKESLFSMNSTPFRTRSRPFANSSGRNLDRTFRTNVESPPFLSSLFPYFPSSPYPLRQHSYNLDGSALFRFIYYSTSVGLERLGKMRCWSPSLSLFRSSSSRKSEQ